ncbi:MAG: Spx/MgsR family RNA polymerase-binding regulatory protein [Pegethrix bostrychoides GSE-TBD4-15B]|jgi:arsenate reductase|uniref:Spx/MgsR family RNA polymerase-binding regulatory protein n=1 Tax=Pegethrix bostrychoides GSE-TBD4-15B TaxID=2839662 RepID=A0A951U2X9_9CYAN|nr:Spx/MgsR family RNA polymerase-binding regulatory protein [Pegethrix bostrychoides GSE-TBD4-15B]
MAVQVYGIPTCTTCKKALQWLTVNDIEYEFINTKEHPPTQAMIQVWVETLGFKPLRNTSGQSYRAIGSEKESWTEAEWIRAFAQDAMLLKRPLFVKAGHAVAVGFKPETLRQTLDR